jgi:hypothetical protein
MGTSQKRIDAVLEAATVRYGRKHCRSVDTIADTAGSLSGDYFLLSAFGPNLDAVNYYVWYNTGASVDPAIAGRTGIEVVIVANDTAAVVATKTKTEIDSHSAFVIKVIDLTNDVLTIENKYMGEPATADGAGTSGFTITNLREGSGMDLGKTSEAIEVSIETQVVEIKSNQTGELVADEIMQGNAATVSLTLIETTAERLQIIMGEGAGDSVTPSLGTKVVGFGESKLFDSLADEAGMLVLHPVRLAASDRSRDMVLWKCAPKPQSINYDGSAPQQLSVEFKGYLDAGKDSKINLIAFGDWHQDLEA